MASTAREQEEWLEELLEGSFQTKEELIVHHFKSHYNLDPSEDTIRDLSRIMRNKKLDDGHIMHFLFSECIGYSCPSQKGRFFPGWLITGKGVYDLSERAYCEICVASQHEA